MLKWPSQSPDLILIEMWCCWNFRRTEEKPTDQKDV